MPPDSVNLLTEIRKDGAKEVVTNHPAIALLMANAMTTDQNLRMANAVRILLPDQDLKEEEVHPVIFQTENVRIHQEGQEKTNRDLKNEKEVTEKDPLSAKEAVDHQEIFQTINVRTHREDREKTNPDSKKEREEKEVTARYFVVEVARRNPLSIRNQDWVSKHPARQNDSVARKMPLREDRHPITTRNASPVLPIANHSANAEKKQKRARKAA